jgi:valine--pyruvate aminotransferase
MQRLGTMAEAHGVPLIVDSAYGLPFPNMVYTDEATPTWNENTIFCMTMSKIGLPAVRTGIVVASKELVDALTSMNAVINLSVSSVGPVIMEDLVRSGEIMTIARDIIRPFYKNRADQAMDWLREALEGCEYRVHKPEGSMFMWLWLPGLPIPTSELYRRLKARNVLVLDGEHFFPGIDDPDWRHMRECIRINFSQEPASVRHGLAIIGEEIRRAYQA